MNDGNSLGLMTKIHWHPVKPSIMALAVCPTIACAIAVEFNAKAGLATLSSRVSRRMLRSKGNEHDCRVESM